MGRAPGSARALLYNSYLTKVMLDVCSIFWKRIVDRAEIVRHSCVGLIQIRFRMRYLVMGWPFKMSTRKQSLIFHDFTAPAKPNHTNLSSGFKAGLPSLGLPHFQNKVTSLVITSQVTSQLLMTRLRRAYPSGRRCHR